MDTPQKEPWPNGGQGETDSLEDILIVVDGPGDTTRRPRPPNIPLDWPRHLIRRPPSEEPPSTPPQAPANP